MSAAMIVAIVLALAALLGIARSLRARGRWRVLRGVLHVAVAALLYLCLFPPTTRQEFAAGELVVLTPGVTAAQRASLSPVADVVALPGVDADGVEAVPDLGTALRRHPQDRNLRIVGGGLPERDRDTARGLVAAFDASPLPRGLVELDAPAAVRAGRRWHVDGRVEGVEGGRVELRDPAGAVVASAPLDRDGRFALEAQAKSEGDVLFALRVSDADGERVDETRVPLAVRSGETLDVLLLAGAPDPDLKYLRRWIVDAGLRLDSRIGLSEGVALTEGDASLDEAALRRADIAIVDERAWSALDAHSKDALRTAVRGGLGLLLRVTGPVPAPVAADWATLGLRTQVADDVQPYRLDQALGLANSGLQFGSAALTLEAGDAAPLLRADDGTPLAWMRNEGEGRVALWLLGDSYRAALGGSRSAFGDLWARVFAQLARARADAMPEMPRDARVDRRAVFCEVGDDAAVEDVSGKRTSLIVDAAAGASRCAGYWPAEAGWHRLVDGERSAAFHVRAADEAPGLRQAADARATRALVGAVAPQSVRGERALPWPRWPLFLAWLALAALLWWLERGRPLAR